MNTLIKLLTFLRIIDAHDGQISLTNVALLIVLGKLVLAPAVSLTDIGALLIALCNYTGKKLINQSNQEPEADTITPQIDALNAKLNEATSKISAMSLQAGIKKLGGN